MEIITLEEPEKFTLTRKLASKGESLRLTIPPDMLEWIGAQGGDYISICADQGKKGRFISMWVKEEVYKDDKIRGNETTSID